MRQAIIWHPTADAGEAVSSNTATKGGGTQHGHYSPQPKKTSHYTSSLGSREAVSEEPESEQHEPEGAGEPEGTFELERVEHETRGAFGPEVATSEELEPKKAFLSEPEADESGEDSFYGESEPEPDQSGQSGAHQEVPAAVRKLYDSFASAPQPITQSRTRSGRDAASPQAPMRAADVDPSPPEPTTLREAQASPEWPNWQRARKKRNGRATRAPGLNKDDARHRSGETLEGGEKSTTIFVAHEGRWDHLRWNARVVHKTVGMGGRRFRHLPRHSAFGFRRNSNAGGRRDQLVLEDAEGDRGRVIRIRVCGAGRSCK